MLLWIFLEFFFYYNLRFVSLKAFLKKAFLMLWYNFLLVLSFLTSVSNSDGWMLP